jgi:archaellum component FlaC
VTAGNGLKPTITDVLPHLSLNQPSMSRSGTESKTSLNTMEKRPEKGPRVTVLQRTLLDRKKADDEERDRVRKGKEQEEREAEIERCPISTPASRVGEVAGAYRESKIPLQPLRTHSQTQVASCSLIESTQGPDSETTALRAEVVQLKQGLRSTKARLRGIEDEREEVKKQQKAAASLDAQDEVARLKRRVKSLDEDLDQTTKELKQLREQLRVSEDRIDELEDEVRALRRQTREQNIIPPDVEAAQSPSPQIVPQEKLRKLSTSKKSPSLDQKTFLVSVNGRENKIMTRRKGGTVPLGLG